MVNLRANFVRAETDSSTDPIKARIDKAEEANAHPAPAGLVIGDPDTDASNVGASLQPFQKAAPSPCLSPVRQQLGLYFQIYPWNVPTRAALGNCRLWTAAAALRRVDRLDATRIQDTAPVIAASTP